MKRPFPNGHKRMFGCNGYITAVAVGQSQRLFSGVRMLTWFYLSFIITCSFPERGDLRSINIYYLLYISGTVLYIIYTV
jgi:hypothetical protein